MNLKVGVSIIIVFFFTCCAMCVQQAKRNLGLDPQIENFRKFTTFSFERLSICYTYTPKDFVEQEIRFVVTEKETIKELQQLFEISSVSPYTLGVDGKICFCTWNEKNEWNAWDIVFRDKIRVSLEYDIHGNSQACIANLKNSEFYQKVFELAWKNNKKLFPQSASEEIRLY